MDRSSYGSELRNIWQPEIEPGLRYVQASQQLEWGHRHFPAVLFELSFSLDRRITGKEALESRTSFRDWHPLWGIDGHIPKFWL